MALMQRYRVSAKAYASEIDGGLAILDTSTASYFYLNPVGAVVWGGLAEPNDIAGLSRLVLERFAVDEATCRRDIESLLTSLEAATLIERAA